MSVTAIIVTFTDDNGFPVRKVFTGEIDDGNRRTFEMEVPLKVGGHYKVQVEVIPSVHAL